MQGKAGDTVAIWLGREVGSRAHHCWEEAEGQKTVKDIDMEARPPYKLGWNERLSLERCPWKEEGPTPRAARIFYCLQSVHVFLRSGRATALGGSGAGAAAAALEKCLNICTKVMPTVQHNSLHPAPSPAM